MRAHIGNIMRKYRLHNRTQIARSSMRYQGSPAFAAARSGPGTGANRATRQAGTGPRRNSAGADRVWNDRPDYYPLRHPSGKTSRPGDQETGDKNISLYSNSEFCCRNRPLRPREEGRIAIVDEPGPTDEEPGGRRPYRREGFCRAGNREQEPPTHTTGVIRVRRNRVVLAPGACAPSLAVMGVAQPGTLISHPQRATGAIVHRSPGRARHKPFRPSRREGHRDAPVALLPRCAM